MILNISEILGPERLAKGLFWTKAWSLVSGCLPVSPGCRNCWLRNMAHRFPRNHPPGIVNDLGQWTGKVVVHPERLDIPLRTRKPQVWAIWSDLLHEKVPWQFIIQSLEIMASEKCANHTFLIITKRPERMKEIMFRLGESIPGNSAININLETLGNFGPNIWLLITCENQEQADCRLPQALQIPAAVRIALVEPCLGAVDLTNINGPGEIQPSWSLTGDALKFDALSDNEDHLFQAVNHLDGVITGGETGPHARPMHPDWPRKLRDDCQAAGVPFFFKSWGEWQDGSDYNKKTLCVYNDGRTCEFTKDAILAEEKSSSINHQQAKPSLMSRFGKKATGSLLEGRTWEELPVIP